MSATTIISAAHAKALWQSMHELSAIGHYGHSAAVIEPQIFTSQHECLCGCGKPIQFPTGKYIVTTGRPLEIAG